MKRSLCSFLLTAVIGLHAAPVHAQLRIGQPSGFTGAVAAGVKENAAGAELYFNAVNARGGVHGQPIELIKVDDKFDPKLTVEVSRELITKKKVLALFLNRGTPHSQALLPLLAEYKVPLVAPSTGAMVLHQPVNPWVFNVRATYQREAARAVEHLSIIGIRRIAILQTDDSFGADGAAGAMSGLERARLQPAMQARFPRENPDFGPLAEQVKTSQAQAVIVIGSVVNVVNATKALRAAGSRAQVITLSNNASEGFIKLLGEHARGVVVTQVFPSERSIASPLIKEAIELARSQGLAGITPAMMEGYAGAKVLTEGLRRAGPNPTPQRLRDALEGMDRFDIGGLEVSYSPTNHTGLDFADLSIIDHNGRFHR
jgi:ABC-type branched-subunit amino acid transport system substrate-binding protein